MGCPFHSAGADDGSDEESGPSEDRGSDQRPDATDSGGSGGLDRREFMRSALAIGGASALSRTVGFFGMPARGAETRSVSVAERANRQHSWNAYERQANGTFLPPEYHVVLFVDYLDSGTPSAADRKTVREAFDRLEEAFEWGHDGLLFTVGYSMSYFERFEADPPRGLRPGNGAIPRMFTAQQIIDGPTIPAPFDRERDAVDLQVTLDREDPVADDDYDVCLHLASDHVQHLLAAESALWNEIGDVNGVSFDDANLHGILTHPITYPERRTGFVGNDALAENVDPDAVGDPESQARTEFAEAVDQGAELTMGYNDLYKNSMPREDNVTMLEDHRFLPGPPNWQPPGVFANGSIMHVSRLDSDLEGWYGENTDTERRHRMFSPHHTKADVGEVGENLGPRESNAPTAAEKPSEERLPMRDVSSDERDVAERTADDYREGRNIGHAQKTARARAQLEAHFRNEDEGPPLDLPQRDGPVARERDDDLSGTDGTNQAVETGFLRRDFNTVDDGRPGTHFVALQAFSVYIAYIRHAMNGVDFDTTLIGQPATPDGSAGFEHAVAEDEDTRDHGILEYITTQRRANVIVPPIRQRALPHPSAIKLVEAGVEPETEFGAPIPPYIGADDEFTLERDGDEFRVGLGDLADAVDPDSVRFGFYRDVNAGGGAAPIRREDDTFVFPVEETRLPAELADAADDGPGESVRARLYAERASDRKPVFGTARVSPP